MATTPSPVIPFALSPSDAEVLLDALDVLEHSKQFGFKLANEDIRQTHAATFDAIERIRQQVRGRPAS